MTPRLPRLRRAAAAPEAAAPPTPATTPATDAGEATADTPRPTPTEGGTTGPAPGAHPEGLAHRVALAERGSFSFARCACGWAGPARRARSQARTDAEQHRAANTG
ncbi:hypothetical protein ACFV3R_33195 [Streptomyces sp. NPDC059740]|uniref:hypothetical protein n=1 Tax=Streptomyces sp. NPDC059740 TaxID=3346926 RepID=UPI00364D35DB